MCKKFRSVVHHHGMFSVLTDPLYNIFSPRSSFPFSRAERRDGRPGGVGARPQIRTAVDAHTAHRHRSPYTGTQPRRHRDSAYIPLTEAHTSRGQKPPQLPIEARKSAADCESWAAAEKLTPLPPLLLAELPPHDERRKVAASEQLPSPAGAAG